MQITETEKQFVESVQKIIDEFVVTRLMDLVDDQVKNFKIPEDRVASLLAKVEDSLGLDEAWEEYTE